MNISLTEDGANHVAVISEENSRGGTDTERFQGMKLKSSAIKKAHKRILALISTALFNGGTVDIVVNEPD